MITRLFSKSKPINFIAVFFITLLALLLSHLKILLEPKTITSVSSFVLLFIVTYLSLLVLNFISIKNKFVRGSSYDIILYAVFLLSIPLLLSNPYIIFANFFVLLGLRRLISLHTQRDLAKKLFDAAFWISVATIFYFWSILFFILILILLIMYTDNVVKHWLTPFVGVITVFVLAVTFSILYHGTFFTVFKSLPYVNFDYTIYNSPSVIIALTMLFSFGAWATIFYAKSVKGQKKSIRPVFKIIPIAVFIGFIIAVLAPQKNGSEFLFILGPLAIIISNYIESMESNWFKELFLGLLIFMPFILLLIF